MPQDTQDTDRRKVLKKIGATTAAAGIGIAGVPPAGAAEPLETEELPDSDEVVAESTETRQFQQVRSSLEEMGFRPDTGAAVAKRTSDPSRAGYKYGVVFPLQRVFITSIWGDEVDSRQLSVNGYLLWSRLLDGSASATGILFGISGDDVSDPSLRQVLSSHDSRQQGTIAFVEPTEIETSTVGDSHSDSGDSVTVDEALKQCVLDNTGILGVTDEVTTCVACMSTPFKLTRSSVLACAYCLHSLHVQHCILTYCARKTRSSGDDYCELVKDLANTPLDLLPGSYGSSIMMTLRSQATGCDADEGTDCTSPLVE